MFKPCIIIPVYNHGPQFIKAFEQLRHLPHQIIVVDDGSKTETEKLLQNLQSKHSNILFLRLPVNKGKGGAIMHGIRHAHKLGYSHALQVDADLQHCLEDIPLFLQLAEQNPAAAINACPVFDESVPKNRLMGRRFTNMWVCIETLSFDIKDAMCGFRVYPIQETYQIIQQNSLSERMGFDIEIMVRLQWAGVSIINQNTKVIYPPDGSSNFRMWADNVEITMVHTKLFFGMLRRLASLLAKRQKKHQL